MNGLLLLLDGCWQALPQLLDNVERWDSLVINRGKPVTHRVFTTFQSPTGVPLRLSLHRFEGCDPGEAKLHPHAWPAAFHVVKGRYTLGLGESPDIHTQPRAIANFDMVAGSRYDMTWPCLWHSVCPMDECWTMMLNGPDYAVPHDLCRRTAGKGLEPLSAADLQQHLETFKRFWHESH